MSSYGKSRRLLFVRMRQVGRGGSIDLNLLPVPNVIMVYHRPRSCGSGGDLVCVFVVRFVGRFTSSTPSIFRSSKSSGYKHPPQQNTVSLWTDSWSSQKTLPGSLCRPTIFRPKSFFARRLVRPVNLALRCTTNRLFFRSILWCREKLFCECGALNVEKSSGMKCGSVFD